MTHEPNPTATVASATLTGVDATKVSIEAHISDGHPGFEIIGLADPATRETRDRVRAAFLSSSLAWPRQRLTVRIMPEPVRSASALDLPIALAVLVAAGQLPLGCLHELAALGELGLDGSIRHVRGIVSLVEAAAARTVVVPEACAVDAQLAAGPTIRPAATLKAAVDALRGDAPWPPVPHHGPHLGTAQELKARDLPWSAEVARALEIAAAGAHHVLLLDPPDDDGASARAVGRTIADLLPPLAADEALETARIYSAAGIARTRDELRRAPFRSVSSPMSVVALVGGTGPTMTPGELSLAHNGVLLFADVSGLDQQGLDAISRPLDVGHVRVSRAGKTIELPARALVVATAASCPCTASERAGCSRADAAHARHASRLVTSFFQRFPIRVSLESQSGPPSRVNTSDALARVADARAAARRRSVPANAELRRRHAAIELSGEAEEFLDFLLRAGSLSGRDVDDVCCVARTIADLNGVGELVDEASALEAVSLRLGPNNRRAATT